MAMPEQAAALPYLLAATVTGFGSAVTWDTSLQEGIPRNKLSPIMAFDDFRSSFRIVFYNARGNKSGS